MKVALDTNRYTDFIRGEQSVATVLEESEEIILPFIVMAELRAGFAAGTKLQQNEQLLTEFMRLHDVRVVFPDQLTIATYAGTYADLRRRAKMIPYNDLWIAALVLQYDLDLCTRDGHFDLLPQIRRV